MIKKSNLLFTWHTALFIAMFRLQCNSAKVERIMREYGWNRELVDSLTDDYEVVRPFQVREGRRLPVDTRDPRSPNISVHYPQTTIVIRSKSRRFKLSLNLNKFLMAKDTMFTELRGERTQSTLGLHENCYYQGKIYFDSNSTVALSTCNGLRGLIVSENGTYAIVALRGGELGRRRPHVLFKTRWHSTALCANTPGQPLQSTAILRHKIIKRHVRRAEQTKFVEVALIADYAMTKQFEFSFQRLVRFSFETINVADMIYNNYLNTRLSVVYIEAWSDKNAIKFENDLTQTMSTLIDYVSNRLYSRQKDLSLLLTSQHFARNERTIATTGDVCTAKASGIITNNNRFMAHETGSLIAHTVGHILGLSHANDDRWPGCKCIANECVMRSGIGLKSLPLATALSDCSQDAYSAILKTGQLSCLYNAPSSLKESCGNGRVDAGEECDCGSIDECNDKCCDAVTCRLAAAAQCSARQTCCRDCKVLKKGHVCRESSGECDVTETCDGKSGDCPFDSHKINGSKCAQEGLCWNGLCADMDIQCKEIWGQNSHVASRECFDRFNTLGVDYGNCGQSSKGTPRKCSKKNSVCGLLHCKGGFSYATNPQWSSLNLQISHDDHKFECKIITDRLKGRVRDGTRCSDDRICLNGDCLHIRHVSLIANCPTNNSTLSCSGHGDCTTSKTCYCHAGWTGKACGRKSIDQWFTTTVKPNDRLNIIDLTEFSKENVNTVALLAILAIFGIILLLCLFLLLVCYRRRSQWPNTKINETEKNGESSVEVNQRSIKFGNMPSYRDEKQRKKRNKWIYEALNRINEASDERDTISVGSKESAALDTGQMDMNGQNEETVPLQRTLALPVPLQLNNIDYLLKQLDVSLSDDKESDGGRMSPVEADRQNPRDQRLSTQNNSHSPTLSSYI